jgi:transcriptional regulator with XRE-family HTH domain
MTLAQRVRDYRYSKGWGPDELASRAAISRTALYQIESGKTELPRAGTLRRIAQALDVPMDTLLGHPETTAAAAAAVNGYLHPVAAGPRTRTTGGEWYSAEGGDLASLGRRLKYDTTDGARFAVEHVSTFDMGAARERERELTVKLHDLLASPFGDAVARIVEEAHRLMPQARVAGGFE